jgi:hypothetical protein
VAADVRKLERVRTDGFGGHLFAVVFYTQFPHLDYPAGQWKDAARASHGRRQYLNQVGIARQHATLARHMPGPPTWPAEGPVLHPLRPPGPEVAAAMRRRSGPDFVTRATPWTLDVAGALRDAAVAAAAWRVP